MSLPPKKNDYEVGYGRPPQHSRFKKGRSGNPTGSRRRSASPWKTVEEALSRKLTITENGQTKRVTMIEALIKRLSVHAASLEAGDVFVPKDAPWLPEFLNEIRAFPAGRHDDQVDALSQLMTANRGGPSVEGWCNDSGKPFPDWMYGENITPHTPAMPKEYDELGWRRVDTGPPWDIE